MNLFAHPMAGMAAAGAIGFAMASHAWGLWLGAVTGAAEASQKRFADVAPQAEPKAAAPVGLKLVVSKPAVAKAPVAARKVVAKAAEPTKAVSAAMVRPTAMAKPVAADDLKALSGIGPKLEKVLNGLGIWTYGQISALNAAEIAWLDAEFGFAGRIDRDGWVEQAKALQQSK